MLANYFKLAIRHLQKRRMYAAINIAGLSIGMTVFILSKLLVAYEYNFDSMFPKRDSIYTVGSVFNPQAEEPISEYPVVRLAYAPLFKLEIQPSITIARSVFRTQLVSVESDQSTQSIAPVRPTNQYLGLRFVDPAFSRIFDFNYLHGDITAIDQANSLVVTASTAQKLFGHTDVVGRMVTLAHKLEMVISAVIEDVATDSHFMSSLMPNTELTAFASINALVALGQFELEGDWTSLEPTDLTYILLPAQYDQDWLQTQVDWVAATVTPKDQYQYISALRVSPLTAVNTATWDALGFPVLQTVQLLGLLVLIAACLNYTNLATAQNFARTQEVGLRKTFGASRGQLLFQFLTESFLLALVAMLLALACVELIIPVYNQWADKIVPLDYWAIMPWLLLLTLLVSMLSGAYPAYLISTHSPVDSLNTSLQQGRVGVMIREIMIAIQFAISIFIVAMVMIIFFQNNKMQALNDVYPRDEVVVLTRLDNVNDSEKKARLKQQITDVNGVRSMSFSSGIPYNASGNHRQIIVDQSKTDDPIDMLSVSVDSDFLTSFEIELLAGSGIIDAKIEGDVITSSQSPQSPQLKQPQKIIDVVINPIALKRLGFDDLQSTAQNHYQSVIGKQFFSIKDKHFNKPQSFRIVGVMPDQYFLGVHMKMQPTFFYHDPSQFRYASIRVDPQQLPDVLAKIDQQWQQVILDYPIRRTMLNYFHDLFFRIPLTINQIIAVFALIALSLALIGLFGLSAFMAQRRTREIGIRKVMGADQKQILSLLIWQFIQPVFYSMLVALPLAYLASDIYLDFFPEKIDFVIGVILLAGLSCVITATSVVILHAKKVARETPVKALRYQ